MGKVLITGAAGFIGRHLLAVLPGDWEVVAVCRPGTDPGGRGARADWVEMDLSVPVDVARLPERVEAVLHLAQSPRYREFPAGARDVFEVNLRSTFDLLEYARGAGASRFVLASSGGVYADSDEALSESDPVDPRGVYLSTKCAAEMLAGSYRDLMRCVVVRLFFVYGPGQRPGMLVPRLVRTVREGDPVCLEGTDGLRLNPVFVGDAVRALGRALRLRHSDKVNIAGPEVLTLREMALSIGEVVGEAPVFETRPPSGRAHLVGDTTRMREVLCDPRVAFRDGIRRTVAATMP